MPKTNLMINPLAYKLIKYIFLSLYILGLGGIWVGWVFLNLSRTKGNFKGGDEVWVLAVAVATATLVISIEE